MQIDLLRLEEVIHPNMRGGEKEVAMRTFSNDKNRIMLGRLIPGSSIGLHAHIGDSETIFFLKGEGKVLCDDVYEPVFPGACHHCPEGHSHSVINDGEEELVFFAVVPKH